MPAKTVTFILCFAVFLLFAVPAKTEVVVFPGKIEFRGTINLSGNEIALKAGIRRSGNGFVVDMDRLRSVLDSNVMVNSYTIESDSGNLVVDINEKYPLFMFLVVDKDLSVPVLADDNINVIVSGRFFNTDIPIIIVRRQVFEQGRDNSDFGGLLDSLKQLRATNRALCSEIQEIEITEENSLRVFLRSRRTLFIIYNNPGGFRRLDKTAGYLDSINRYPYSIDLRDDTVLVK